MRNLFKEEWLWVLVAHLVIACVAVRFLGIWAVLESYAVPFGSLLGLILLALAIGGSLFLWRTKPVYVSIAVRLVVAGLLIWALGKHPYDYYTVLRWVVCVSAGYFVYLAYTLRKIPWAWMFGVMVVLFNPIIPIHLKRSTWAPIDVISAIAMLVSVLFVREKKPISPSQQV